MYATDIYLYNYLTTYSTENIPEDKKCTGIYVSLFSKAGKV